MTHYLRHANQTIVDIEASESDLHAVVCIGAYSRLLLSVDRSAMNECIATFDSLQEIRGGWFENHHPSGQTINEYVRQCLTTVAERWGLAYITD